MGYVMHLPPRRVHADLRVVTRTLPDPAAGIVGRPVAAVEINGIRRAPGNLLLRQAGNIRESRGQRCIGEEVVMRFPGFRKNIDADLNRRRARRLV